MSPLWMVTTVETFETLVMVVTYFLLGTLFKRMIETVVTFETYLFARNIVQNGKGCQCWQGVALW